MAINVMSRVCLSVAQRNALVY